MTVRPAPVRVGARSGARRRGPLQPVTAFQRTRLPVPVAARSHPRPTDRALLEGKSTSPSRELGLRGSPVAAGSGQPAAFSWPREFPNPLTLFLMVGGRVSADPVFLASSSSWCVYFFLAVGSWFPTHRVVKPGPAQAPTPYQDRGEGADP